MVLGIHIFDKDLKDQIMHIIVNNRDRIREGNKNSSNKNINQQIFGYKFAKGNLFVVYFDQRLGAAQAKRWSK